MSESFHFDDLQAFATGTVGPKGQRVFYLQADDGELVTFKLEKQQVAALAEYLARLLEDVPAIDSLPNPDPLVEPLEPEWAVGPMGVAYDEAADRVVVMAEELVEDESMPSATARFYLRRDQAHNFVHQAREIVADGRDPCPYCGRPLEPGTTWCPCHN